VSHPETAFTKSTSEPRLTWILCEHLKTISDSARLTGRWGQENQFGTIDAKAGKVLKSYRTDIEYFSNRSLERIRLIFEFKKIDDSAKTLRKYWGVDGMRRFIDGDYSVGEPFALMAGILLKPKAACVAALKNVLRSEKCKVLQWRNGGDIIEPSTAFPRDAEFDTEHVRPVGKAPTQGYIRIGHLFLCFVVPSASQ